MGLKNSENCLIPSACPSVELSEIGRIITRQWYELKNRYPHIQLDQFVVMPNHVHGIIILENTRAGQSPAPTVGHIIGSYKSITTKMSNIFDKTPNRYIWQRGFYDHIIRDDNDLQRIRQYIDDNPAKWQEDKYFI
jgi:putative transposase